MEMENSFDNSCSLGGDMLAYLYDELTSDGRERFESHLTDCGPCIEKFAEISDARYSVYEWKNVEFAPLATPRFVVPVEAEAASASWLDSIRASFGWNNAAALAGGLAVLILSVFGLAIFLSAPPAPTVANIEPPRSSAPAATGALPTPVFNVETAEVPTPKIEAPDTKIVAARSAERDRVAVRKQPETARVKPARPALVENVQSRRTTTNRRLDNSPTLGQYVEDRDETLRLSDLFDDLDSKELD